MQPVTCKIKRNFTDDISTRSCLSCVYLRLFLGSAGSCKPKGTTSLLLLYAFFWALPRRRNFICRRFGTFCLFHLHRQVGMKFLYTYLHMKMEQSVPKRRHIKFRHRGITQQKAYKIQNTTKIWNQEFSVPVQPLRKVWRALRSESWYADNRETNCKFYGDTFVQTYRICFINVIAIGRPIIFSNVTEDQLSGLSELEMCSQFPLYSALSNTIWWNE